MEPKYARLTPELYSYVCHHASRANNPVLATLRAETEALGDISRMLISKEQGDFMSLLVAAVSAEPGIGAADLALQQAGDLVDEILFGTVLVAHVRD